MTNETMPLDISTTPELAHLAHEVARTGKRQLLTEHGTAIAVVEPLKPRRRTRRAQAKPLTMDDPIWSIVGSITEDVGSDVSANKHTYLAEAYAAESA